MHWDPGRLFMPKSSDKMGVDMLFQVKSIVPRAIFVPPYHISSPLWRVQMVHEVTYNVPLGTVVSYFVDSFASLTANRRCWFSSSGRDICVVGNGLSVPCFRLDDSIEWSMETMFRIPNSSTVTARN